MIKFKSNAAVVFDNLALHASTVIDNKETIMLPVVQNVLAEMKVRIHTNGQDASGARIGTYSKGYMVKRTGAYKNKGAKGSGFFTKGKSATYSVKTKEASKTKSSTRPNYHRGPDTKVIASLTRQMENDFKVVSISKGYGLGYSNQDNFAKSLFVEATYKKKIFELTRREYEIVLKIQDRIAKHIAG